ncbi:hypothetical protein [Thalassobellus suaedae]|uniref:Uncharacterized protein n=1 Tax=Thalassobellus suaedae TaxID=3074124 RepID=A0ABY9XS16_9FLAO|nr:hypothetical protein RHP51_16795 [Flavobacteriaceae bacterium HL-DH14]
MRPFAIAGIQMKVSAVASNVEMMKLKIDITMNLYPWIQMIMFSELCAYVPLTHTAQPIPNNFEAEMQAILKNMGYGCSLVLYLKKVRAKFIIQPRLSIPKVK